MTMIASPTLFYATKYYNILKTEVSLVPLDSHHPTLDIEYPLKLTRKPLTLSCFSGYKVKKLAFTIFIKND